MNAVECSVICNNDTNPHNCELEFHYHTTHTTGFVDAVSHSRRASVNSAITRYAEIEILPNIDKTLAKNDREMGAI
jgi:hypothetical protein